MQQPFRNKMLLIAAFLSFLPVAGSFLYAQVSAGAISGTVTDPTQAAIAGARVTITNQETGVSHTLTTDRSGFYSAEGLPVGLYTIDVTTPNFKESVTSGIQIDPGARRANNVVLEVGSATAQVTVTANTEQVNTESSESGGTLTSTQIDNLMLNGRNFQTLASPFPVSAAPTGPMDWAAAGSLVEPSLS